MQFHETEATEAGVQRSWACRFDVGRHQYILRIEQRHFLKAENPHYEDRIIAEGDEFEIWGVVRYALHKLI